MNNLLLLWLSLSLSGSLVALTLILLKPFLQNLRKTWQYYIWLLVIFRLLIPFSPDINIIGNLFQQTKTYLTTQNTKVENPLKINHSNFTASPNIVTFENTNLGTSMTTVNFQFIEEHIFGILWLIVSIFLLVRKIYGYIQFIKAIKKESKIVSVGQLPSSLQKVSAEMGIKKKISVCTNSLIRAPMLIGIVKPMIVLPDKPICNTELVYIFRHELTHYQYRDFLYKWLTEITVCLHWFNPFVYWIRKHINQNCEFSCDEIVVLCLDNTERKCYGETLLNSIVINNSVKTDVISLSLNSDGKLIKERLYAIMEYKHKSKFIILITTILTIVLLCGTVFSGAYIASASENVNTSSIAKPIHINKDLEPEGKISLGSQYLLSNTTCKILLTWSGDENLNAVCTSSSGFKKSYIIKNGNLITFPIDTTDNYTISVKNNTKTKINNIKGSINFEQNLLQNTNISVQSNSSTIQNTNIDVQLNTSTINTVVYENAEIRRYEDKDGHPYIHDIKTNNTTKKIIGNQYGMLAFDKDGNPLKVNWWSLDTESENTYFYLNEGTAEIASSETYDVFGGWSLNFWDNDLSVDKIVYVLFCDKEITFEDGTVWKNPDFENWITTYKGKKIDIDILKNYYPYKQKITF